MCLPTFNCTNNPNPCFLCCTSLKMSDYYRKQSLRPWILYCTPYKVRIHPRREQQEPFQELGAFPLQEPGSGFSCRVVFRPPEGPCSGIVLQWIWDFLLCCRRILIGWVQLHCQKLNASIASGDPNCLHWEGFCALIWTQRWEVMTTQILLR